MTMVIIHPADGDHPERVTGPWLVYIQGIPGAVLAADLDDINGHLRYLPQQPAELFGLAGCDTWECGLVATGAILGEEPHGYRFRWACDDHKPAPETPLTGVWLPGVIRARESYSRRSGTDMADLVRVLSQFPVPAEVFAQPSCRVCLKLLQPGSFPGMTWVDPGGKSRCGRRASHQVVPGGPADVIARYADEVREQLADRHLARLASLHRRALKLA